MRSFDATLEIKYRELPVTIHYSVKKTATDTLVGLIQHDEITKIIVKDKRGNDITKKLQARHPKTWLEVNSLIDQELEGVIYD